MTPRSASKRPSLAGLTARHLIGAAVVLVVLVVAATAVLVAVKAPGPAVGGSGRVPRPDHVVVVVLENKDRTGVVGSSRSACC